MRGKVYLFGVYRFKNSTKALSQRSVSTYQQQQCLAPSTEINSFSEAQAL